MKNVNIFSWFWEMLVTPFWVSWKWKKRKTSWGISRWRSRRFWNKNFHNKNDSKRKTWYWKKYPNYSDLSKNMSNAKKIREKLWWL